MSRFDLHHGDCRDVMRTMDANSIDSIVSDPPYGLSFMGKGWDHGVPSVEFWVEALRVAKPGAHLIAFGGTRTYHRLACAIEDAGWEVRDMITWVSNKTFPKSLNVGKAIDKMDASFEQEMRRLHFTAWVRAQGVKSAQIDEATQTNMGSHYTTHPTQPAIMTRKHLEACRHLFSEVPAWVERECDIRSVESKNFAAREVVGTTSVPVGHAFAGETYGGDSSNHDVLITAPATAAAAQWEGWGTGLKPTCEPICLARKPLIGTVAQNVLTHGTGAINVDACRVDGEPVPINKLEEWSGFGQKIRPKYEQQVNSNGRFPSNFIHDGSDEVVSEFPQSNSGVAVRKNIGVSSKGMFHPGGKETDPREDVGYYDSGSAARFFYCARASKQDREDGNTHPTVKPTALMRYLCKLVTQPNGIILDPFMGSGSTGKAAMLERFRFVGIDITPEYIDIARARIEHASKHDDGELFSGCT